MKIAIVSYPIAFQSQGGVAIQMLETMASLVRLGIDATLFDARYDKFAEFDLIHVFGAIHGNHAIVESARNRSVPVVLSPILHPPFNRWRTLTSDFCDRFAGRLTKWEVRTSYGQIKSALTSANRIIVLGEAERKIVEQGYGVDTNTVSVVPNGVSPSFFAANPAAFHEKYGVNRRIVLCVAYISPYKNQLGLIRALKNVSCDIFLIGGCRPNDRTYLEKCLSIGGKRLHYLGAIDHGDQMLASSYAAADVMALVSQTECAPLAAIESLAAGTPVVITRNHSVDLISNENVFISVDATNLDEIRDHVCQLLDRPPAQEACIAAAKNLTWDSVGKALREIYAGVLADSRVTSGKARRLDSR